MVVVGIKAEPTRPTGPGPALSPLDDTVEKVGDGLLSSLATKDCGATCTFELGGGGGGGKLADGASGLVETGGATVWHFRVPKVACKEQ